MPDRRFSIASRSSDQKSPFTRRKATETNQAIVPEKAAIPSTIRQRCENGIFFDLAEFDPFAVFDDFGDLFKPLSANIWPMVAKKASRNALMAFVQFLARTRRTN
jgi:hypothetical protein